MASNRDFSFIYQGASTDILCGPLQQLEDPAVLMLLQPHEQQQHTTTTTTDVDIHHHQPLQCDNNNNGSSSSFLSPSLPLTNDDNEKRTTPTIITTINNGEISPETCWDSPSSETGGLTISNNTTAMNTSPTSNSISTTASRRRSRTSPLSNPARRAEHNATERARRESLNGKFRLLASILPNLQNSKKPSKSQIIEKALEWVEHSLLSEERYQFELLRLEQENKRIGDQLQQCLVSSQVQWPIQNTPPQEGIHHHYNNNNNSYCYAVPSPPSSTTSTSVSSSNYSCGSNNSNTNVTPITVTPSSTTVDVSLISQQQQQYHHHHHYHSAS